jgi:argininosuccinate lyase
MHKAWDGRFTKATQPEVEVFTASISFDRELASVDLLGSLAHVQMLGAVGILSPQETQEIRKGLIEIGERLVQGEISFSSVDEDIHMKIENELKSIIGPLAGKMHTGRSRNDQVALDLHLYLRDKVVGLIELLHELSAALLQKGKEHIDLIMPGYTHLQRGQPILFAHHLLAYVAMFQRDMDRLIESWARINQSPLGACALAGTGLPIDRQLVADILKFDSLYGNSIDAVSDRDFCIEFLADAALIMMHLSRLSEEMILWSSQEFAFIELDDAYCTGSSIMPQKKNPDVPELVRGKTGRVYGALIATLTLLKGLPLAYNKDMQEDKEALFDSVKTLAASLSIYKGLIETLQVRSNNMLEAAEGGLLNATELADYLSGKGVPFREAHAIVGKIVRYCVENQLTLEELSLKQLHNFSPLFAEDVNALLDLKRIVNTRNSQGGTSSIQVERQLAEQAILSQERLHWIAAKRKLLSEAKREAIGAVDL